MAELMVHGMKIPVVEVKWQVAMVLQWIVLVDIKIVKVKIDSAERSLVFGDCVARVNPNYRPAMHIDTDEANAAGCSGEVWGEIVK